MFDVTFPVTDGVIAAGIRGALTSWSGLVVQRERPQTMPRRLITIRNDSGPILDVRSLRRYGINVWADSPLDAERIAHDALAAVGPRKLPHPIVHTDEHSGPYEIKDEPAYTFNGSPLSHFYFTFRATVRGE